MGETAGYPVMLSLEGKRCIVVGGGKIAARKVAGLLEAGADVLVISPHLEESLVMLAAEGRIQTQQSVYTPGMLAALQPPLVFAATDSHDVNQQVVVEAQLLNIMVTVVHDSGTSDFSNMATMRRGAITIRFMPISTPA